VAAHRHDQARERQTVGAGIQLEGRIVAQDRMILLVTHERLHTVKAYQPSRKINANEAAPAAVDERSGQIFAAVNAPL
jgi:hypothetical protein